AATKTTASSSNARRRLASETWKGGNISVALTIADHWDYKEARADRVGSDHADGLDQHRSRYSADSRKPSSLSRNLVLIAGDAPTNVSRAPFPLSNFRNMRSSPKKRASITRVLDRSMIMALFVDINVSRKHEIAFPMYPSVASPHRLITKAL